MPSRRGERFQGLKRRMKPANLGTSVLFIFRSYHSRVFYIIKLLISVLDVAKTKLALLKTRSIKETEYSHMTCISLKWNIILICPISISYKALSSPPWDNEKRYRRLEYKFFMQTFIKQCPQGRVKGFKVRRGGWNQPI